MTGTHSCGTALTGWTDITYSSGRRVTTGYCPSCRRWLTDPTPCPGCGAPTWDGLHRNGHRDCVMAEVEVHP